MRQRSALTPSRMMVAACAALVSASSRKRRSSSATRLCNWSALFRAPLAVEDHAVRACYAGLRMQETVTRYADEVQRSHGVQVAIRVGLNSGEIVIRTIGNDLNMDYRAVGQTRHSRGRCET